MKRGDVYLVKKPTPTDPKRQRAFVVVSRRPLIDSNYETVICAPVFSKYLGLETGSLKHHSAIHCDGLVSIAKSRLTDFRGSLGFERLAALALALKTAVDVQ